MKAFTNSLHAEGQFVPPHLPYTVYKDFYITKDDLVRKYNQSRINEVDKICVSGDFDNWEGEKFKMTKTIDGDQVYFYIRIPITKRERYLKKLNFEYCIYFKDFTNKITFINENESHTEEANYFYI